MPGIYAYHRQTFLHIDINQSMRWMSIDSTFSPDYDSAHKTTQTESWTPFKSEYDSEQHGTPVTKWLAPCSVWRAFPSSLRNRLLGTFFLSFFLLVESIFLTFGAGDSDPRSVLYGRAIGRGWRVYEKVLYASAGQRSFYLAAGSLVMPILHLEIGIFLCVCALLSFATLVRSWNNEGKIKLPLHENGQSEDPWNSGEDHDPFDVTKPEDLIDGYPIKEELFWAKVRVSHHQCYFSFPNRRSDSTEKALSHFGCGDHLRPSIRLHWMAFRCRRLYSRNCCFFHLCCFCFIRSGSFNSIYWSKWRQFSLENSHSSRLALDRCFLAYPG